VTDGHLPGDEHEVMRYASCVTSVSWIPSEAIESILHYGIDAGLGHYDDPLPDTLGNLEDWRAADRFRFANHLRAWIERLAEYGPGVLLGERAPL
jgi:hypothetical protein